MLATSMKLAGKVTEPPLRETVMQPSSRGWRSASRAERWYSGISSKNRTPWWARLISPGLTVRLPPPHSATVLAVWWGERNGRSVTMPSSPKMPATEWILVTSSASAKVISGMMEGMQRASIVLPVPGGPTSSRLCPPLTATSRARRATAWPLTKARSNLPVCGAAAP